MQSHAAYKSAFQHKKDKQPDEEKLTSEDRRKYIIACLQQQKKQKLAELKAETAAFDIKIASLQGGKVTK